MLRKASLLAAALVLIAVVLLGVHRMSLPTVTVGAGSIALVQAGPVNRNAGGPAPGTLAAVSTPGTALVMDIAVTGGGPVISMPTGWALLVAGYAIANTWGFETWVLLNNPGGILSVTPSFPTGSASTSQLTEWANVVAASALEASGSASDAVGGGTILTPITTGNVLTAGDIAIAGWAQQTVAIGAVTFSSPVGWTRLGDNGSDVTIATHFDTEYRYGPAVGSPASAILTSSAATNNKAAGTIIVLKSGATTLDITAFLEYGSLIAKRNTFDFGLMLGGKWLLEDGSGFYLLEDGSGDYLLDTYVPQLGDPVTVYYPSSP